MYFFIDVKEQRAAVFKKMGDAARLLLAITSDHQVTPKDPVAACFQVDGYGSRYFVLSLSGAFNLLCDLPEREAKSTAMALMKAVDLLYSQGKNNDRFTERNMQENRTG